MSSASPSPAELSLTYVTCSENGLYGLQHLFRRGWPIAGVITISAQTAAANAVSGYVDVSDWCAANGLRLRVLDGYTVRPNDVADVGGLVLVVNGWNRLIAPEALAVAVRGAIGVHAGHPPLGLGRAPLPWNIIKGHRDLEVYVFALTARADDGDIFASQTVEITPHDTVQTLYEKVMHQGAALIDRALLTIASGGAGRPQDVRFAVHYPKRTPEDGQVDFSESAQTIVDFVRGQSRPYPGAFSFLKGTRWVFWSAQRFDTFAFRDVDRVPGRIVLSLPSGLVVQTGTETLWITDAQAGSVPLRSLGSAEREAFVGECFSPLGEGRHDLRDRDARQ